MILVDIRIFQSLCIHNSELFYCFSIFDLQSCNPDPLLPAVLDRTPGDEVDRANEEDRQQHRIHSLFSIYSVQQVNKNDSEPAV